MLMRKCVLFCLLLLLLCVQPDRAAPVKVIPNSLNSENFILLRTVQGSGGIQSANLKYFHTATAGESFILFSHNTNNLLLSGYWPFLLWFKPTSVDELNTTFPTTFVLYQNYPNPFNPHTTISYELPVQCNISIEIFNSIGQKIRQLYDHVEGPGIYQIIWDALDNQKQSMGSGVYFCQITAKSLIDESVYFKKTMKMILMK